VGGGSSWVWPQVAGPFSSAIAAARCVSQNSFRARSRSSGGFRSCWNKNWTARSRASRRFPITPSHHAVQFQFREMKKLPRCGFAGYPFGNMIAGAIVKQPRVNKPLHTRYRVNDLERTVKFYKDVLGLEEVRRNKSPRGSELVFLKAPGSEEQIEITYFPGSGPVQVQPDLTHLAFEVDNLAEFGQHLAGLGLKFSDGPTQSS